MSRKLILTTLLALPLGIAGLVYAGVQANAESNAAGYVCPVTGEELPCPKCCPFK
mgnify:CR=1 FL=1